MATLGPILTALNQAGVRYVVVGGVAVVIRGYPRFTADLDLVVDLDPLEARKAVRALTDAGLVPTVPVDPDDFADPDVRGAWIRDKGMLVFSMIDPANPMRHVDLFVSHPIPFHELWAASDVLDLDGILVRTASVEHLIRMKQEAGRPRDLEDIDMLLQLRENEPDE